MPEEPLKFRILWAHRTNRDRDCRVARLEFPKARVAEVKDRLRAAGFDVEICDPQW